MLEQKVLEALRNAQRPLYVTEVQRLVGIKQWHSARTILYKLVVKGLVKAEETDRETFFSIAEPTSKPELRPFVATIPELESLIVKPKLEVTLKHRSLIFKYGDKKLETKPTDWNELRKYTLEAVAKAFEKELMAEGFPIKQDELLPEMKKVLRK